MAGKRAIGEGTLYQRAADGRWLGSIHFGYDDRGGPIRRYVSAKTERESLRKLRVLSRLRDDGLPPRSDRATVESLARAWYDEELRTRVARTTADSPTRCRRARSPRATAAGRTIDTELLCDLGVSDPVAGEQQAFGLAHGSVRERDAGSDLSERSTLLLRQRQLRSRWSCHRSRDHICSGIYVSLHELPRWGRLSIHTVQVGTPTALRPAALLPAPAWRHRRGYGATYL